MAQHQRSRIASLTSAGETEQGNYVNAGCDVMKFDGAGSLWMVLANFIHARAISLRALR